MFLSFVKNHPSHVRNGTFLSTLKIFDFEWMGGILEAELATSGGS